MFWIIGEPNENVPNAVFSADLRHLATNPNLTNQLARQEYNHTLNQVQAVLAPAIGANEPLYILAHSGYQEVNQVETPWVGGRYFNDFVPDMVGKFTVAGLSNRILWFLVCHTGHDAQTMANLLSAAGVRNTRVFMPKDFMYISQRGIPHLLANFDDVEKANQEVAKWDCDFSRIIGSMDTGEGWAGCEIDAHGTVTTLSTVDAIEAVQDRFDPAGEGEL